MMSLLNVTVKRGKISAGGDHQQPKPNASGDQHNTFLVLKLENVKSSTLPLKGTDPAWDEEFLFETNKTAGVDLLVELWQKGLIWDNVIGYKLIQVDQLFQGQMAAVSDGGGGLNGGCYPGAGGGGGGPSKFHAKRWFTLDADLLVTGVDAPTIIGTKTPTPYMVLLDLRWELTSFVLADGMAGGGGGGAYNLYEHSYVDNYNKAGGYGTTTTGYDNPYGYDDPDQSLQQYNNSGVYASAGYGGVVGGGEEDPSYGRVGGDDNRSYLIGNSYGAGSGGGDGYDGGRESTFQDNNYSFYDNTYQLPSCDTTKRPKLLPQVPAEYSGSAAAPSAYISDSAIPTTATTSFGATTFDNNLESLADPYRSSSDCNNYDTYGLDDLRGDYLGSAALVRPSRSRRKVLPSAPAAQPLYDEFESDVLSYNSQPPSKLCSRMASDMYDYDMDSVIGGVPNHVDQLNWKNLSRGHSYEDEYGEFMGPPPPRSVSKRKVLPQIPVQSKYGAAKSLPATPATSASAINCKSRQLPYPAPTKGIPTSSTTGSVYGNETNRPYPFQSSLSAEARDDHSSYMFNQQSQPHAISMPTSSIGGFNSGFQQRPAAKPTATTTASTSLLADMKSLFSKTSSSILPAMSSTFNNVSSSLSATTPHSYAATSSTCPPVTALANEGEVSYDFMKSNKFEETTIANGSMMEPTSQNVSYYDDTELNNNLVMGGEPPEQSMYGNQYDGYGMSVASNSMNVPKMLPSGGHQQVPFTSSSSSTSAARNFFQSKNNTTFHSTVENMSEEDPLSSTLNPAGCMRMSTNNSYEIEDMSVDKSLYGSSFHTDIDEYDLIANGDIKQNFTYNDKGSTAVPTGGGGELNGTGSGSLKTDAKSKLNSIFMDNDVVNNNNSSANKTTTVYGTPTQSNSNDYAVDEYHHSEYSFNDGTGGYANRGELDEYGVIAYEHQQQQQHQRPEDYYGDHQGHGGNEEDHYYDGYQANQSRKLGATGPDANSQDYYYGQVELVPVGVSNLEGIEELDEYERDEKDVEEDDEGGGGGDLSLSHHKPYDYNNYYAYKKDSLKGQQQARDHELSEFLEEEEESEADKLDEYEQEEDEENEDDKQDANNKQWSDDEIIETETKKPVPPPPTTTHSEPPITTFAATGISALMAMSPAVATQSSLSPGSMLAAGITTTLAANISNTITTTITGSPSIIFDAGENEPAAAGSISKAMGAMAAGEGGPKVTAKQRWHWAYNKIIMQLNVSTWSCILSFYSPSFYPSAVFGTLFNCCMTYLARQTAGWRHYFLFLDTHLKYH